MSDAWPYSKTFELATKHPKAPALLCLCDPPACTGCISPALGTFPKLLYPPGWSQPPRDVVLGISYLPDPAGTSVTSCTLVWWLGHRGPILDLVMLFPLVWQLKFPSCEWEFHMSWGQSGICGVWPPKSARMVPSAEHVDTVGYIQTLNSSEKAAQVFYSSFQLLPCRLFIQRGAGVKPDLSQFAPNPYCFPVKIWWRANMKKTPKPTEAPASSLTGKKKV